MGNKTVAHTIREITQKHLSENNGILLGQCISAVGWVNGTVPNCKNVVELPMTDIAGAGFAVGTAMVGRRPIFVIRFQDFLTLNGSQLINYAAKSKELHGKPTPVFIRAVGSEGLGPVHSGVLHSIFMHFPGFFVCSPMTPGEYQEAWNVFMKNDDPMLVSEHRSSYQNTQEFSDTVKDDAKISLFGISSTRFCLAEAAQLLEQEGISCNVFHLPWLKPFPIKDAYLAGLKKCGLGLVIDATFEICGSSRSIAYDLSDASGVPVKALGLMDKTKCLCVPFQNKAPDTQRIVEKVNQLFTLNERTEY